MKLVCVCVGCGKSLTRRDDWDYYGSYPAHVGCADKAQSMVDEDRANGLGSDNDPDRIIPIPIRRRKAA